MHRIVLPNATDFDAWRRAAVSARDSNIPPSAVHWIIEGEQSSLFDALAAPAIAPLSCDRKPSAIPDIFDRLIVAEALRLGLPLITSDSVIHASGLVNVV